MRQDPLCTLPNSPWIIRLSSVAGRDRHYLLCECCAFSLLLWVALSFAFGSNLTCVDWSVFWWKLQGDPLSISGVLSVQLSLSCKFYLLWFLQTFSSVSLTQQVLLAVREFPFSVQGLETLKAVNWGNCRTYSSLLSRSQGLLYFIA